MLVAIDGPAGAGKSTVARRVAEALGFTFLDSGAMYRAVALAALERGAEPAEVAPTVRIDLGDRVLLDGRDVTADIRTPKVTEAAYLAQISMSATCAGCRRPARTLRIRNGATPMRVASACCWMVARRPAASSGRRWMRRRCWC